MRTATPTRRLALAVLVLATVLAWPSGRAAAQLTLGFEPVASGLASPVGAVHAGDGSGRLFIIEQVGRIRIHDGVSLLATPFLDVSARITCCGERGLLGLAFHPDYATNGLFYVHYTDTAGNTAIARYHVSADPNVADATSGQLLLTVAQPFGNHKGGQIAFGPDGYLYIGLGDGGDAGDPGNRAQNLGTLLGKILRIDVDGAFPYAIPATNPFLSTPGALLEIWAYGLRNPWRFSFDRETGALFIADVGQGQREEVNFQSATSAGGENYGWRLMEGSLCFNPPSGCNNGTLTLPILEYDHSRGCSISGGYRYRGGRFPQFVGRYFYGDFCTGRIWAGSQGGAAWSTVELVDTTLSITSFGEDEHGEIYVVHYGSGSNGTVQRIVETVQSFSLTVSRAGSGTGTVASAPAGILCGATCSAAVGAGARVTLTAAPAAGGAFAGWSGGGCSGTGPCVVAVNAATSVLATFTTPAATLTITRNGTGTGLVTSTPGGIGCPVTCSVTFVPGTSVTLAAQADLGSGFGGWSGGGCAGTGSCVVTVNADTTVNATFARQGFVLSVTTTGSGGVSSSPAAIECPTTCAAAFSSGSSVTLTAVAGAGATFAGWSGACTGTVASCTVAMTAARAVMATFTTTFSGTFADEPLVAGQTTVKAVHVTDLRVAINAERTRRMLNPVGWTDAELTAGETRLRAVHIVEMRTALNQAYQAAGRTPPTYTDASLGNGSTQVKAAHIAELRAAAQALR